MLLHFGDGGIDVSRLEMLYETSSRRNHPLISRLTDRTNEVLHHVDQRFHHNHHHRIFGGARENSMEVEMNRRLIEKVYFVASRAFSRRDIVLWTLDIFGGGALTRGAHRDRFN